ncbi:AraC family transcriptional regulator (plasmid) [Variovorax sp. WS11]|nr:AraC family transcriptional regulator [Variovorax sp. WS11]NDZ17422.1 AraC family transcriptional regulator [Variovorax sp. WS11]
MSERVVQQGCLPAGQICFALLSGHAAGTSRMQGHELNEDFLFLLRGGEEFTIQRANGMELFALTFQAEDFLRLLDERPWPQQSRALLTRQVVRVPAGALQRMRKQLLGMLGQPLPRHSASRASGRDLAGSTGLFESLGALFGHACGVREAQSSASAGYIVEECHRIVAASGDTPPNVEALCRRLRTSRRSLQHSFRQVADTSPLHYLRGLRLNLVRTRLMSTRQAQLSVSQAAADQGFEHLSHFTERYKALFGELPSKTSRALDAGDTASRVGTPLLRKR